MSEEGFLANFYSNVFDLSVGAPIYFFPSRYEGHVIDSNSRESQIDLICPMDQLHDIVVCGLQIGINLSHS